MSDSTHEKPAVKRGRPPTGTAKTATARSNDRDAALLAAGGRVINRVRLSPAAAAALARMAGRFVDERTAIEAALIEMDSK